jgi:hypothetical protein
VSATAGWWSVRDGVTRCWLSMAPRLGRRAVRTLCRRCRAAGPARHRPLTGFTQGKHPTLPARCAVLSP